MATLKQDPSGWYRIRFWYGGRQYKRSLQTKDGRRAEAAEHRISEMIDLLNNGRLSVPVGVDPGLFIITDGKLLAKPVAPKVITLKDLINLYQQTLPEGTKEASTAYTEGIHFKHLLRHLGEKVPVQVLTPGDLQRYLEKRSQDTWRGKRIGAATVRKEVETFRALWNWAADLQHLTGSALVKGLRYPKTLNKPPFQTLEEIERAIVRGGLSEEEKEALWDSLFLTRQQIDDVLGHIKAAKSQPFVYPMFVFVADTGVRRSEMLRSHVEDFNLAEKTVVVREKKRDRSKTLTYRHIDLTPRLVGVMTDWFDQHPGGPHTFCTCRDRQLTRQEATRALRRVLAGSRWEKTRGFHVFRHSFASNHAADGMPQEVIDQYMGHQTEAMRRRYRHLVPNQREQAKLLLARIR